MVPFLAWWFAIPLWQALLHDLALVAFLAVHTLVFTWAFDRLFGLPASARCAAPDGACVCRATPL
jgi:uncharacterized membrane protein